ncbi:transposase [Stenotrophomonas rhizophila]|uniref:Transposase n=1 Tax=Stenotrophomonas rhizophila TaxID=216778 RepID=A0A7V7YL55_9GAMM|nr:transposase [Stenotrophomonas rhizophila]
MEPYNRTVSCAWLSGNLLNDVQQIQDIAARWLWIYNHERQNIALGMKAPMQKLGLAA